MLYLADNLAYIPYTVVDEPLFVIHQIDIMISVAGSNLLQTFKEVSAVFVYREGRLDANVSCTYLLVYTEMPHSELLYSNAHGELI